MPVPALLCQLVPSARALFCARNLSPSGQVLSNIRVPASPDLSARMLSSPGSTFSNSVTSLPGPLDSLRVPATNLPADYLAGYARIPHLSRGDGPRLRG